MTIKIPFPLAMALACLVAFFSIHNPRSTIAEASPNDPIVRQLLDAMPAQNSGGMCVESWKVTCSTTATAITPPSGDAMISYYGQTPGSTETGGTTLVAVGDSLIADPAFATRNSPVFAGNTIQSWFAAAQLEYCRADTGTVDVFVRALTRRATCR